MHPLFLLNILCLFGVSSRMKDFVSGMRGGMGRLIAVLLVLATLLPHSVTQSNVAAPIIQAVEIGNGIALHYVDVGKGVPVIFVHGSLSDGGYWADQVGEFAKHYRAIAYSRRSITTRIPMRLILDTPSVVDAEDLAAFIGDPASRQSRSDRSFIRSTHGLVSGDQTPRTRSRSCFGGTSRRLALGTSAGR